MTNIKANANDRLAEELPARTRSSARSSASRLSAKAKNFVPQQGDHTLGWQGIDFGAGDGVIVPGDVDQEAAVSFDSRLRHVSFNEPAAAVEHALGADEEKDNSSLPELGWSAASEHRTGLFLVQIGLARPLPTYSRP